MSQQAYLLKKEEELNAWEADLIARERKLKLSTTSGTSTRRPPAHADQQQLGDLQQQIEAEALALLNKKALLDLREKELNEKQELLVLKQKELDAEVARLSDLVAQQQSLIAKHKEMFQNSNSKQRAPPPIVTTSRSSDNLSRGSSPKAGSNNNLSPSKYHQGVLKDVNPKQVKSYVEELSDSDEENNNKDGSAKKPRGVASSPRYLAAQAEMKKMSEDEYFRSQREDTQAMDAEDNAEYDGTILKELIETGAVTEEEMEQFLSMGYGPGEIIQAVMVRMSGGGGGGVVVNDDEEDEEEDSEDYDP